MLRIPSASCLLFTGLMLAGCSEPGPLVVDQGASAAALESANFPTALASSAWQAHARTVIAAHNTTPPAATRIYALLSIAQYGAVVDAGVAVDGEGTPGFGVGGRARFERQRGAIAGASAQVLSFVYPDAAAALEQRVSAESGAGPGGEHPDFARGVVLGRAMGNTMIAWAKADRFTAAWTGTLPTGPGMWFANGPPAGPMIGGTRPYFMSAGDQFRPAAPPVFGEAGFLAALDEIKTFSLTRTASQLALAQSWNQSTGTATTVGFWNALAAGYIADHDLDELAATRILALTDAAVMDAVIGCWDAKYFYNYIRPSQATSGITLPIGLPNHPSFPSGHSCVSSAAATVIGHFFPEHATTVNALVAEAGLSRMYGGIHYRFDIEAGQNLGRLVAQLAIRVDAGGLLSAVRQERP